MPHELLKATVTENVTQHIMLIDAKVLRNEISISVLVKQASLKNEKWCVIVTIVVSGVDSECAWGAIPVVGVGGCRDHTIKSPPTLLTTATVTSHC